MVNPYTREDWELQYCIQNCIPEQCWIKITDNVIPYIKDGYWISNYGNVWSDLSYSMLVPHQQHAYDYLFVGLILNSDNGNTNRCNIAIHRLVMLCFCPIENPEKFVVNHKDGVKYHNWIWNLEWVTQLENIQHAYDTGLKQRGEKSGSAKLTDSEVHEICKMLVKGIPYSDIAKSLGLYKKLYYANSTISSIRLGLSWTHISSQYEFSKVYDDDGKLFTDSEVHIICKILSEHVADYKYILNALNYDVDSMTDIEKRSYVSAISNIRNGTRYSNISSKYNICEGRADRVFTDEQVHTICKELLKGTRYSDILIILGYDLNKLTETEINNLKCNLIRINRGISYKHISSQYNLANAPSQKRSAYHFDDKEVESIKKMIIEYPDMGNKAILLKMMDVSKLTNGEIKKLTDAISYIRRFKMDK